MTRRHRRAGRHASVAAAALLLVAACSTPTSGDLPAGAPPRAAVSLGVAGPFDERTASAAWAAGASGAIVDVTWREAQPREDGWDDGYLDGVADRIAALRRTGYQVVLNTGIQDAPGWVLAAPGARFVDQDGRAYTDASVPNLVFDTGLRALAQRYLTGLLDRFGGQVAVVRAGGGYWGELSYPAVRGADGRLQNRYWAFDRYAAASDPVPGWRPGDPSPHGEARRFLTWYLDALVDYQSWQFTALRTAGWAGPVAVLYPSWGMRPGDFDAAVADDLSGRSTAEVNGEVQRGHDHAGQVAALTDPKAIVWGTWAENRGTLEELRSLARAHGLPLVAENANPLSAAQLRETVAAAGELGLTAFFYVRASDLACGCDGHAGFADLRADYTALGRRRS